MRNSITPKILFIKDVEHLLRRNRLTLRRMWYRGDFPEPTGRINNRLYWKAEIIDQWINARECGQ